MLLHEWEYNAADEPQLLVSPIGEVTFDKEEPIENLITWVYENGSFVPIGKLTDNESFSIISDYIGRPVLAFDEKGEKVWSCDYDIYGRVHKETLHPSLGGAGGGFIPFRQLGQYYDSEIDLCYNRFRYYDCNTGTYISQDPIGLVGGLSFYAYVRDVNKFVDVLGLSDCDIAKIKKLVEQIPEKYKKNFMCVEFSGNLKKLMQKENISGELLELKTISNKGMAGNVWSDKMGELISTNGIHKAVKVDYLVFDNINVNGVKIDDWINDLNSPLGHKIVGVKF